MTVGKQLYKTAGNIFAAGVMLDGMQYRMMFDGRRNDMPATQVTDR